MTIENASLAPQVSEKKAFIGGKMKFEFMGRTFDNREAAEAERQAHMQRLAAKGEEDARAREASKRQAALFAEYDENPEYVTYFITSEPISDMRDKWFGLLGREETGLCQIVNPADLADKIYKALRELSLMGYEVVSVTSVESGVGAYKFPGGKVVGGAGWGYSFTSGVVIAAKRKQ